MVLYVIRISALILIIKKKYIKSLFSWEEKLRRENEIRERVRKNKK